MKTPNTETAVNTARVISRRLRKAGFVRGSFGKYRLFGKPDGELEGFIVSVIGVGKLINIIWYEKVGRHTPARAEKTAEMATVLEAMGYKIEKHKDSITIACDRNH